MPTLTQEGSHYAHTNTRRSLLSIPRCEKTLHFLYFYVQCSFHLSLMCTPPPDILYTYKTFTVIKPYIYNKLLYPTSFIILSFHSPFPRFVDPTKCLKTQLLEPHTYDTPNFETLSFSINIYSPCLTNDKVNCVYIRANRYFLVYTSILLHFFIVFILCLILSLLICCGILVLLVLRHQVIHVGLCLSELHLIHSLTSVPM